MEWFRQSLPRQVYCKVVDVSITPETMWEPSGRGERFRDSLTGAWVCHVSLVRRTKQTRQTEETRWTRSPPRAAKWFLPPFLFVSLSEGG